MSRSYKKNPFCGDRKSKKDKRLANHRVRQFFRRNIDNEVSQSDFKKLYPTWMICDFWARCSWGQFLQGELEHQRWKLYKYGKAEEIDQEKLYEEWKKWYYWK